MDLSNNFVPAETKNQRSLNRFKRRRQLFSSDIIFDSVQFLRLRDLLRINMANRRVLRGPCRRALDRLMPPRIIGPLQISISGVHQEWVFGGGTPEAHPFPQVPPPSDKILGIARITISFHAVNAQFLEGVGAFLHLSERLLGQHDLLLDRNRWNNNDFEGALEGILPLLPTGGFRVIEMDTFSLYLTSEGLLGTLLRSQAFSRTNRLLFTDSEGFSHQLNPKQFEDCVTWLHSPTTDGAPRTLILCVRHLHPGYEDDFISLVIERFKHDEDNPTKFCLIILSPFGVPLLDFALFQQTNGELMKRPLINEERGDALSLELIRRGSGRFGRPFSELFSMDPGIENQFQSGSFSSTSKFANIFCSRIQHVGGYILRRDVAIGPWSRPELFEARRRHPVPEQHSLLHIKWS